MFRIAGVVVLLLSFCLPCRADTFADMWNSSGQSEHCFHLAGWLDGTRGICGSRSDDLCGLVKGNFELQSLERIVSIVYEIPLYWDVPYTTIFGLSLRYLEGRIGTEDFARRLNAAAEGRERYTAPAEKHARKERRPSASAPKPRSPAPEAGNSGTAGQNTGSLEKLLKEAGNL